MGRRATGSVYESCGSLYLSVSLGKRKSFRFTTCRNLQEAELRKTVIVDVIERLKGVGRIEVAERFCKSAVEADEQTLARLLRLIENVIAGREDPVHVADPQDAESPSATTTFGAFATMWTSNELAQRYRRRVKEVDHKENVLRLKKHVFPIAFKGRKIEDTPLNEFTLDHADHVLAQPTLPDRSLRHVAQCMSRVLKLAVYPTRILDRSPFPPGWLPPPNQPKERSYLFPSEEVLLLGHRPCPLVRRILFGFCAREGVRRENAVTLEWTNLTLDLPGGEAIISLDVTKNGRGGTWSLDPGTAEALRRWRRVCPSERLVFPSEALPRYRRRRAGQPLAVEHAAADLRAALQAGGVDRAKLYEHGENRQRLRFHDLRATFVTLAVATGRTEDWVVRRTGHLSSAMVARYRRDAKTAEELKLGWLMPMHEIIPELAGLASDRSKPALIVLPGGGAATDTKSAATRAP